MTVRPNEFDYFLQFGPPNIFNLRGNLPIICAVQRHANENTTIKYTVLTYLEGA